MSDTLQTLFDDGFKTVFQQVATENKSAAESVLYEDEIPEILTLEEMQNA